MADPVFLITGASSGIGAATARQAAAAGYRLVLAARSEGALRALADDLGGVERALAVRCDVTSWTDQQALARTAQQHFGQIDVAWANAGFEGGSSFIGGDDTPDVWREMILTNVYGAALTARAVLPALRDTSGHLFLTGSVAGRVVVSGSLYSATKWAVAAMAQAIRQEAHALGVHVTLVEPGIVETPFWKGQAPIQGLQAEDVARAVLYALGQPPRVNVNEIVLRPIGQDV